jgi:hypothetical protein
MNSQFTNSHSPEPNAAPRAVSYGVSCTVPCIVGFVLLIFLAKVTAPAAQLGCPLCTTANPALALVESVILTAASQVLQACLFDHQQFMQGLVQMVASLWLLLLIIVAALLLAGRIRR